MRLKPFFRHTFDLLRTALMLGVIAFVNTQQTQAQPVSITPEMPDAFETIDIDKTSVVGNGEYYFIQFYKEEIYSPYLYQSFLGEKGEGQPMQAMDYMPFAPNRQWTLVAGSDANHFKLKSKRGFFAYWDTAANVFKTTENESNASDFRYINRGSYRSGFKQLVASAGTNEISMCRYATSEWGQIVNSTSNAGYVRFARLKPTAAHIIYYRGEGIDNTNPQASTTRHYLTYSGTTNNSSADWRESTVSSRRSIIPSDKSLWTLPTAAAYHQDGLWALEESDIDGEFYIKRYGTEQYMNAVMLSDNKCISDLGIKNDNTGRYKLSDPAFNRYTPIQNVQHQTTSLTKGMFYNWNGYWANANQGSQADDVTFNVGNGVNLGGGALVVGSGEVNCLKYADLSRYSEMTINGTPDMQLRVLMSRQTDNNGPMVEKNVTIGSDGTAVVDLTNLILNWDDNHYLQTQTGSASVRMTYINGSDDAVNTSYGQVYAGTPAYCGYNKITNGTVELANKGWGVNNITYLEVDASAISGTINRVTLTGDFQQISARGLSYGVGYNSAAWSSTMTWNNADRSITTLGNEKTVGRATNDTPLTFDITDAFTTTGNKKMTILVYQTAAGGGYIKNPTVSVEYTPNEVSFAHLNAIKTTNNSPGGIINSITLEEKNIRYLHHSAGGDGWQVSQWTNQYNDIWNAGFYPVEVPVPNKDEFFQVRLVLNPPYGTQEERQYIPLNPKQKDGITRNVLLKDGDNIIGATYNADDNWLNCFQYTDDNVLSVPSGYQKIVVRFASPVVGNWAISGIVNGSQGWEQIPEGSLYYEMDLTGINTISDFTIFSMTNANPVSIAIAEIYFYKGAMINNENGAAMNSSEGFPSLWELEQVDDYTTFRLKNPTTGRYLAGNGQMTEPNDPTNAEINPNSKFWTDLSVRWYIPTVQADKEIPVDAYVTHRESYLKAYSLQHSDKELDIQGLNTEADSEWKIPTKYEGSIPGLELMQKVNHFEITHYIKLGNTKVVEFPTVLNKNNDHIYFQRFYNYDEENNSTTMDFDLDNLKAHLSLDTRDDGDVQYFLYKNGMVTGQKLAWDGINQGGFARNALRRVNFTNSDGQPFTLAVDVSRYSDLTYANETDKLNGNLEEPSLTMRYIYYMRDAKVMAWDLTAKEFKGFDFIDSKEGLNFLEAKTFHFPAKQISYEKEKKVGYRGEFIGLRHVFSDYWVFDGNGTTDDNLVSAVNDNNGGKIEVRIYDPHGTGIRLGGYNPNINMEESGSSAVEGNDADYQGFYFYDKVVGKTDYGNSRFVVFRYPSSGEAAQKGEDNPVYINVYLNNNGTRYQLAQFTIIFDEGSETLPWKSRNASTSYPADGFVQGSDRDPRNLWAKAGKPIAKVTFDYPENSKYEFPTKGVTKQGWNENATGSLDNCSPIPLDFSGTNYSFSGFECNWGSYSMVNSMTTNYGNHQKAWPADDVTYGYGYEVGGVDEFKPDEGFQKGFLYIDASEQPGDICSAPFEGDFCTGDLLMVSGWISGSNTMGGSDNRCPGGVTMTIKGERTLHNEDGTIVYDEFGKPKKVTETLYRFCPGQCYELDDGPNDPDGRGGENGTNNVIWQQFYFEFKVTAKHERHWLEVNNNCVSSNGGDFMLDNIEVYAMVPELKVEMNTPICMNPEDTEMQLLKLSIGYEDLIEASGINETSMDTEQYFSLVFLDKQKFLNTFHQKLIEYGDIDPGLTVEEVEQGIEAGVYQDIQHTSQDSHHGYKRAYDAAFDAALVGNPAFWEDGNTSSDPDGGVLVYKWNSNFSAMPTYSFSNAVNRTSAVYGYTDPDTEKRYIIINGNYPNLPWKPLTEYYLINYNGKPTSIDMRYEDFNICSDCNHAKVFQITPPYNILGLEKSDATNDYVVCEGQIPTMLLDLEGYDLNGNAVAMEDLNFDWWLGDASYTETVTEGGNTITIYPKLATLENYHSQSKTVGGVTIMLDKALATLRAHYPGVNSLDGLLPQLSGEQPLTQDMIDYLDELVKAGELVLRQKSISVPSEPVDNTNNPYFYLVACPIHDDAFVRALNPAANEYVSHYCDEPQGLRVKVGQKAPTLKTGFVPGEHGFNEYDYNFPANTDPVLSIRLAKAAQFETVKNTEEEAEGGTLNYTVNHLWLPIRNAQTQGAPGVITKANDDNIYLAASNDPTWDKKIYKSMSKTGSLPVVGRIVQLKAINTSGGNNLQAQNDYNLLRVYFTKNFGVREGYNYTLSLPFQEDDNSNACDGTILINLKIVPDYEVWTGAAENPLDPTASNTDWNNDENWRRADGNTTVSNEYYGDELYRANGAVTNEDSPLHEYVTNKDNYYSSNKNSNRPSSDQIFRKGFAPLYCTHILMKSDEWGNAPVLYDAIDGHAVISETGSKLINSPFPNLRDTSTPILKFDMQARRYDMWEETYGVAPDRGSADRTHDLIAEMYQINSCDEIVFQPGTELRNAHLLNYNTAWVEYQLDAKRWYLLGSPLQGTIAGEWYAPTGNTPQQKTTYYDPVRFGAGYDRYSPAIYQRSWDKAKAVLYEVGANYSTTDNPDDQALNQYSTLPGSTLQGDWNETPNGTTWNITGADTYLDRLGYKPFGDKKVNVAIKGIWSNTYNDAIVDYTKGGFSVMVMNHLKGNSADVKAIVRLPKEDTMYDYYEFSQTGAANGGTDTELADVRNYLNRALNRGRLKTDLLLPESTHRTESAASIYGDKRTITRIPIKEDALQTMNANYRNHTEDVPAGISNLGYYLVENPFPCGLDMEAFFAANPGLEKKYWILTPGGQQLVQWVDATGWVPPTVAVVNDGDPNDETTYEFAAANGVLAPGQGFFVQAKTPATPPAEPVKTVAVNFNSSMQAQTRYGVPSESRTFTVVVGQAQTMEQLVIDGEPQFTDVDLDGDGVYGEEGEKEPVMVPVYQKDGDGYVLDEEGNKIPVLTDIEEEVTIYNYVQDTTEGKVFPLRARTRSIEAMDQGLVITAQRGDMKSNALVMKHEGASNDFLPSEDTETFITSDLEQVPTVYTLCGRLATTINSIHDFRSLPIGVESNSDAPCTLTFKGVEMLGDSIAFYDAVEQKLTPLESGMKFVVSGQTQNRYYLVRSLIKEEAAAETHIQIFTEGLTAKVIASTAEPITNVRCYDTAGRLIHSASPQTSEYSFSLPIAGIYIIDAETENDRKTKKVMTK